MAIPSNPTVADIVTEGLKRGGRVNPTAGDISTATSIYFQEVKADLYLKAARHATLINQAAQATTKGISRYNWPSACEAIRSVQLIDAPTDGYWRATAQTGGASSITLSASFSQATDDIIGRFVFITAGTGVGQFAQIIDYNNTTKVATIEAAWATLDSTWVSPNSTSVYLVEQIRRKLWDYSKPVDWTTIATPSQLGTPTQAVASGKQVWLDYTPDRVYVLFYDYWSALDQLDESTSSVLLGHLRKFRNVWTQGVAVKVMQRYDEDRYMSELNVYNVMLDLYGTDAASVGQVTFRDIS